jgi:hypothetical protein
VRLAERGKTFPKASKELTPPENSRKTHIFGDFRSSAGLHENKLHYAYPQVPNPLMFEHALRMDNEHMKAASKLCWLNAEKLSRKICMNISL